MFNFLFLILLIFLPLKQAKAQKDSLIIKLIDGQTFVPAKLIEIIPTDTLKFQYRDEVLNVSIESIDKIIIARESKVAEYILGGAIQGAIYGAVGGIKLASESDNYAVFAPILALVLASGGLFIGAMLGMIQGAAMSEDIIYDFQKIKKTEKIKIIKELIEKDKKRK